jgi:DNA uptake protein ComE-like DNA-binding protein
VWLSLIPMGLGAWAPAYAGARAQNRRWLSLGILWSLIALAGWIAAVSSNGHSGLAGGLIILGWVGAIATSFAIRSAYAQQLGSSFHAAISGAEERLAERQRARRLCTENPRLAREMGVGRPDLPGSQDAGLVDVNSAPAAVIGRLPGIDDELATRIVEARAETQGFTSVEDLGATLDLDGDLVEGLRAQAVFLPR